MIKINEIICPKCGGKLQLYGSVKRIVRTKGRKTKWVMIRRLKCANCNMVHRELPDYLLPHKQYELEVIQGVLEGFITSDTLGYEDYPCHQIMMKWVQELQLSL